MTSGLVGSIARHETARFAIRSSTGAQLPPPSSVRQTPPPALPAHILEGLAGWITIARVRPPMFPGPSAVQPAWLGLNPAVAMRGTPRLAVAPAGTPAR